MSIESVMPSNHLFLCHPLLLLPSIFPCARVFSSESALLIKWPNYWSFSFSINLSNEYSGLLVRLNQGMPFGAWLFCVGHWSSDCGEVPRQGALAEPEPEVWTIQPLLTYLQECEVKAGMGSSLPTSFVCLMSVLVRKVFITLH